MKIAIFLFFEGKMPPSTTQGLLRILSVERIGVKSSLSCPPILWSSTKSMEIKCWNIPNHKLMLGATYGYDPAIKIGGKVLTKDKYRPSAEGPGIEFKEIKIKSAGLNKSLFKNPTF